MGTKSFFVILILPGNFVSGTLTDNAITNFIDTGQRVHLSGSKKRAPHRLQKSPSRRLQGADPRCGGLAASGADGCEIGEIVITQRIGRGIFSRMPERDGRGRQSWIELFHFSIELPIIWPNCKRSQLGPAQWMTNPNQRYDAILQQI